MIRAKTTLKNFNPQFPLTCPSIPHSALIMEAPMPLHSSLLTKVGEKFFKTMEAAPNNRGSILSSKTGNLRE